MSDPLQSHYSRITQAIVDGRVVPLLGAGVNLCGRPEKTAWQRGQYLPSGYELAQYLAEKFRYPADEVLDLLRVSQYAAIMEGPGPLYEKLRDLFDADYPATTLHQLLASIPGLLRSKGYTPRYQLIVTTNYDDVLERAFAGANEPYDLVSYVADGEKRGKFIHRFPDGQTRLIDIPNQYLDLSLDKRTVILKIHGAIDRVDAEQDSFVITEDHYIDFLTRTDISNLLPITLAVELRKSHFLFLGYGLRDWNLRVILHRIWGEQKLKYKSWAVQLNPDPLDREFWQKRDVEIFNIRLEDYVDAVAAHLQVLPAKQ
ncbi:MAG TPA: SIR2 family protein [Pyrinomonadaceae bacterium]|nr:SIR2 family protein [Pyrinomonadaceae bacterium]